MRRTIGEIARMIGAETPDSVWNELVVNGVSIDTRTLKPGNLYIPIVGERFDGHAFAAKAIEQGAAAMLWRRGQANPPEHFPIIAVEDTEKALQTLAAAYRRQLSKLTVVGVTGSNGKTSTKDLVASVLSTAYKTQKTAGNLNNHLGVPLTLLSLEEDTEYAVVEMGMSDLGEIRFLASLAKPNIAVITNVSEVHLGDLHTRERILQAKLEITEALTEQDALIYFGDHSPLRQAVQELKLRCNTIAFGEGVQNDVIAERIEVSRHGVQFNTEGERFGIPVLGKHQAINALAAVAVARLAGLTTDDIREGLSQVQLTGMRNEWITAGGLSIMNDTYKSNPSSVRAALDLLYSLQPFEQKIAVLGEMVELGDESAAFHREIGEGLQPEQLDYVFTIGTIAREIADSARQRFMPDRIIHCSDQQELLGRLKQTIRSNCLLLVKGSRTLELEKVVEELRQSAVAEA